MKTFPDEISGDRIVFLDFLRVFACLMVILVHSCEFFYIGAPLGNSYAIAFAPGNSAFWVNILDSAFRMSVPLFIMTSSYLLLPLKESPGRFYKRRFVRILIPFLIWSLLYAVLPILWGDLTAEGVKSNLMRLLYNFNDSSGHLWFMYMLIGLYLFMPIISPWLKECSKRFEQVFLGIWFLTTFYHYGKLIVPGFYGECAWNEFGTFWYFSGFLGYLVLAHYIRTYVNWSLKKSLIVGLCLFVVGYAITAGVFHSRSLTSETVIDLELSWRFCDFNVALMAAGTFLIFKKINCPEGKFYNCVKDISKLSYGMYLMHIFFLGLFYKLIGDKLPMPMNLLVIGVCTFVLSYLVSKVLSLFKGGKYIVG